MLLTVDVGNTNIVLGLFEGETLRVSCRLATLRDRTADELWVLVSRIFAERGVVLSQIDDVVLSSVVPSLTRTITEMVSRALDRPVLSIDVNNAGLPVRYENRDELGADRLVNGVAALQLYGRSKQPVIVVDFGTATTFDALSVDGEYCGGIICPGVEISADVLFQRAARLPRVDVRKPQDLLGRTTVTSMQSGLFFGHVAMVEGIVRRLRDEFDGNAEAVCVATGGLASVIAEETNVINEVNLDLALVGLRLVWERNQPLEKGGRPA